MSEGGSLFNHGYLGTEFKWWIGQVADDATWRDNMNPAKFKEKDSVPGWGRRYKVRILGMHDWVELQQRVFPMISCLGQMLCIPSQQVVDRQVLSKLQQ